MVALAETSGADAARNVMVRLTQPDLGDSKVHFVLNDKSISRCSDSERNTNGGGATPTGSELG